MSLKVESGPRPQWSPANKEIIRRQATQTTTSTSNSLEGHSVTPVKDFTYYQLIATREAIENIRQIAKSLNRAIMKFDDKVLANTERVSVPNWQLSPRSLIAVREISGGFSIFTTESVIQGGDLEKALEEQGHKFGIDSRKVTTINVVEDKDWERVKSKFSLDIALRKRYPNKDINLFPGQPSMAEAIASESKELKGAFPLLEEATTQRSKLSQNELTFYGSIINGIGYACFVPRNDPKTTTDLKPLKLYKVIQRIGEVEGKEITNMEALFLSRIVIKQTVEMAQKYAADAYKACPEAFSDPKKRTWTLSKMAAIASIKI